MRSRLALADPWAPVERGLALGVCGLGGRLPAPPTGPEHAVSRTTAVYDLRSGRRLRRFIDVADGAEVWTRDHDGRFFRGVLDGPWAYDRSTAASEVDLVHVRPCAWDEVSVVAVPTAVADAFRRGGLNFQRVRSAAS